TGNINAARIDRIVLLYLCPKQTDGSRWVLKIPRIVAAHQNEAVLFRSIMKQLDRNFSAREWIKNQNKRPALCGGIRRGKIKSVIVCGLRCHRDGAVYGPGGRRLRRGTTGDQHNQN